MALVRIHPLTLQFGDEALEADLRSHQLHSSRPIMAFFGGLGILFLELSGYGRSMLQLVCCLPILGTCLVSHETINCNFNQLLPTIKLHTLYCYVWSLSWTVNGAVWWQMIACGNIQRLQPTEFAKVGACCGLWITVLVTQHLLHISFAYRCVVLTLALSIALSGAVWEALTLSVFVGEACGYVLERSMRTGFLLRVEVMERLRCEKERAVYDLNIAQARRSKSPSLEDDHQSIPETMMTFGTNSELADIFPQESEQGEPGSREEPPPNDPNALGIAKAHLDLGEARGMMGRRAAASLRQRHMQLLCEERHARLS